MDARVSLITLDVDDDGHICEIAHNPAWKLDANGALMLPE